MCTCATCACVVCVCVLACLCVCAYVRVSTNTSNLLLALMTCSSLTPKNTTLDKNLPPNFDKVDVLQLYANVRALEGITKVGFCQLEYTYPTPCSLSLSLSLFNSPTPQGLARWYILLASITSLNTGNKKSRLVQVGRFFPDDRRLAVFLLQGIYHRKIEIFRERKDETRKLLLE